MAHAPDQPIESLARLRLLVAALGEAAHAKWWNTEFLTAPGRRFLGRLYPRTASAAALRATAIAARILHDSSIGRGGAYHLFRLPGRLESQLRTLGECGFFDEVLRELDPDDAYDSLIAGLQALACDQLPLGPGARRIGSYRDLERGAVVPRWATVYLNAFREGYRVFPYVETESWF